MRDKRCADGVLAECERIIRKGGRIKFGKLWWQHDDLIPYAGQVAMVWPDYYFTELSVFPNNRRDVSLKAYAFKP